MMLIRLLISLSHFFCFVYFVGGYFNTAYSLRAYTKYSSRADMDKSHKT